MEAFGVSPCRIFTTSAYFTPYAVQRLPTVSPAVTVWAYTAYTALSALSDGNRYALPACTFPRSERLLIVLSKSATSTDYRTLSMPHTDLTDSPEVMVWEIR